MRDFAESPDSDFVSCETIRSVFGIEPMRTTITDLRGRPWGFFAQDRRQFLWCRVGEGRETTLSFTRAITAHSPLIVFVEDGRMSASAYVLSVDDMKSVPRAGS